MLAAEAVRSDKVRRVGPSGAGQARGGGGGGLEGRGSQSWKKGNGDRRRASAESSINIPNLPITYHMFPIINKLKWKFCRTCK